MKQSLILTIIFLFLAAFFAGRLSNPQPVVKLVPYSPERQATIDDLLDAIEQVESGGDVNAIGSCGEVGAFQIRKIYVDDVNRIGVEKAEINHYGFIPYEYEWRTNRNISRDMVLIYLRHYAIMRRIGRKPTFEDMARIHNGGPDGWKKDCTKPYWEKVRKVLYE